MCIADREPELNNLTRQGITNMLQWLLGLFKSSSPVTERKLITKGRAEPEPDIQLPPPFLRREAMLDRNQQVAAYVFTVEKPAAMRAHTWHATTQQFFGNVLIDHFSTGELDRLLGKRLVFLPLGPASLEHSKLDQLPRKNLVIEFDPPLGMEFP